MIGITIKKIWVKWHLETILGRNVFCRNSETILSHTVDVSVPKISALNDKSTIDLWISKDIELCQGFEWTLSCACYLGYHYLSIGTLGMETPHSLIVSGPITFISRRSNSVVFELIMVIISPSVHVVRN